MSDFADERKVFESYFKANWNADPNSGGAIVQYENVKFTQPTNTPWCRFSITAVRTVPAAMGATKKRTYGYVYLSMFVPKDQGTAPMRALGDAFDTIWSLKHIQCARGQATFQTTNVKTIGDHNGFFMAEAVCTYWRDTDTTLQPTPIDGGDFSGSSAQDIDGGSF